MFTVGHGPTGIENIKAHPFFASINWEVTLNNCIAYYLLKACQELDYLMDLGYIYTSLFVDLKSYCLNYCLKVLIRT